MLLAWRQKAWRALPVFGDAMDAAGAMRRTGHRDAEATSEVNCARRGGRVPKPSAKKTGLSSVIPIGVSMVLSLIRDVVDSAALAGLWFCPHVPACATPVVVHARQVAIETEEARVRTLAVVTLTTVEGVGRQ